MEKKYDHLQHEAECQKKWDQEKTYSQENNPGPMYSIDTPPPTVSGSLHIGHIFSYTQTDIIARYKRMNGFSVYYPFGFDDNGLATERFIEKQKKIRAHEMSRTDFIKLCLEVTQESEKEFINLWKRIGLSADWDYCYSTIDKQSRALSQRSFIELYKKNFTYRKDEPALYCTTCRTSVAQAELDDREQPSSFNDIIFTGENGQELIIGTTRPELLPACVAIFYHPDDKRYQQLKNIYATVPLFGHKVIILPDELVDPEKGTGLVMCCTFGDKTDIQWVKKHNLPYKQVLGRDGKFITGTELIEGLKVPDARKTILAELEKKELLKNQKAITHAVNIHERCKSEIEYISLTQWFLKILPYKDTFISLADKIEWYPGYMKSRYTNWVENIQWDWCLSRQRFYGIPFPVWYCQKCGEILLADPQSLPIDPQETPYGKPCSNCGSEDIVPETDVMDTWNTSSLTPYITLALKEKENVNILSEKKLPMSMRPQAHDIIRTWAFYTIVKAWMHEETIPWKEIVISGHVLGGKEKLSKSLGGGPLSPDNLLAQYPADAVRYWTASGTLGTDITFSENQLKIGQKLVVKLWNAFKFAWQYLEDFEPSSFGLNAADNLGTVNSWILDRASKTFHQFTAYFEKNEFSLALETIDTFFWNDFCDNYIELIKDILMNQNAYEKQEVDATRATLYTLGLRILQMYAPFVPYITETLYNIIYKKFEKTSSLHQTKYSAIQIAYTFDDSVVTMKQLLYMIGLIRKLKTEHHLSLRTELATLTIHIKDASTLLLVKNHESLIKAMSKAHTIVFENSDTASNLLVEENGSWHAHIVSQ